MHFLLKTHSLNIEHPQKLYYRTFIPPPPTKDAHDSPPFSRQMKTILEGVSQSIHLWHFQAEFDAHDLTYVLQMCATARALKGCLANCKNVERGHKDVVPTSKTGGLRNAKQTSTFWTQFVMSFLSNEVKCERWG